MLRALGWWKNLKIKERTSSERKVFCNPDCGVGKERRKRKKNRRELNISKLCVIVQQAQCLRPYKFWSEIAFTVLMCALKFLFRKKLFFSSVLKVLRWNC